MGRLLASGFTGTVTGADMLPRPAGIRDDIRWIQTDLNEPTPLADASFDAIVSVRGHRASREPAGGVSRVSSSPETARKAPADHT